MGSSSEVEYDDSNVWEFGKASYFDLHVKVGGDIFKLNRSCLVEVSAYMKQHIGLANSSQRHPLVIELSPKRVLPEAFGTICIWIYTGRLSLTPQNLGSIWLAGKYLRMPDIIKMCQGFIRNVPKESSENIVRVFHTNQQKAQRKTATYSSDGSCTHSCAPDIITPLPMRSSDSKEMSSSVSKTSNNFSSEYKSNSLRSSSLSKLLPNFHNGHQHSSSDNFSAIESRVSEEKQRSLSKSDGIDESVATPAPSCTAKFKSSDTLETLIDFGTNTTNMEKNGTAFLGISSLDFLMLLKKTNHESTAATRPWASIPAVNECAILKLASANPIAVATVLSWIKDGNCLLTVWNLEPIIRVSCYLSLEPLFLKCRDFALLLIKLLEDKLVQHRVIESQDLPWLRNAFHNIGTYFDECCAALHAIRVAVSGWDQLPNAIVINSDSVPCTVPHREHGNMWLHKLGEPQSKSSLKVVGLSNAPKLAEIASVKDDNSSLPPHSPANPKTPTTQNVTPGSGKLRQKLLKKWAARSKNLNKFKSLAQGLPHAAQLADPKHPLAPSPKASNRLPEVAKKDNEDLVRNKNATPDDNKNKSKAVPDQKADTNDSKQPKANKPATASAKPKAPDTSPQSIDTSKMLQEIRESKRKIGRFEYLKRSPPLVTSKNATTASALNGKKNPSRSNANY